MTPQTPTVSEAEVDAAAMALFGLDFVITATGLKQQQWGDVFITEQNIYRRRARVALTAAAQARAKNGETT